MRNLGCWTVRWSSLCEAGRDCTAQIRHFSPFEARRCSRVGFTLIELLVVIAILGILIVLVMPSINRARENAQSVKCASNLHQIGVMTELYCADSGNILPTVFGWTSNGSTYLEYLFSQVKGMSIPDVREAMARDQLPSHCPVLLPSDIASVPRLAPSGARFWITYGASRNIGSNGGFQSMDGLPNFSRLTVSHPSKCLCLADADGSAINPGQGPGWRASARHHGRSNVLWMDGHVTSELTSQLNDHWGDYWDWTP